MNYPRGKTYNASLRYSRTIVRACYTRYRDITSRNLSIPGLNLALCTFLFERYLVRTLSSLTALISVSRGNRARSATLPCYLISREGSKYNVPARARRANLDNIDFSRHSTYSLPSELYSLVIYGRYVEGFYVFTIEI